MTLVSECSESELIRRYQEVLPVGERTMIGIGDDCAQIATPEGSFVVSTDVIVEDQHFHRYWSDAYQIGARITAQNLADIAGMGGYTSSIVISVVLTPDTEVEWLIDVVRGIGDRAREVGAGVVGGDMSAGEKMVLSMTVMGWCEGDPVVRSGAKPGDVIAVSGRVGFSHAGLDLLLGEHIDPAIRDDESMGIMAEALNMYRAPEPPLETGPAAARAGAHAMMDLSDGIAMDGTRMAKASGVIIDLDPTALEREADPLRQLAEICGVNPVEWVVFGGEDHGMIAAFGPDATIPEGFRIVGHVREVGEGENANMFLNGHALRGKWDHFKNE